MCKNCEALMINHLLCHEMGCPDAWKDERRSCNWCGSEFTPEESGQKCCCDSCFNAYWGYPDDDEITEE